MNIRLLSFLLISVLFFACTNKESEQMIIGSWKVDNWQVADSGEKLDGKMKFTFEEGGTYELDYGSKQEAGKYWITGDVLHTQAEGESEIIVKITKLVPDSLGFEMNRGGTIELVDFLRVE